MYRKIAHQIGVLLLTALAAVAFPATASAETRALLAAVWQFGSPIIPDLKGPANDLAAIEALVRSEGATDVTVLQNTQVTRTSIESALHDLGLRSKPGDWIVFYYSGHGAEAEAAIKGTTDGDFDQFVPLAGFDPGRQDTERFIVDKDFYSWMARYIRPDVQILMIADTCHSGTLNRSIDSRAFRFTPRLAFRGDASEIKLAQRPAPRFAALSAGPGQAARALGQGGVPIDRPDLPNLVFVAASQDDQLALEAALPVSDAPSRGVMTYSLEQGLTTRGADDKTLAADLDHDGKIEVHEIGVYLDTQVRAMTGQRQQPRVYYASGMSNAPLFATPGPSKPTPAQSLPAVFAYGANARLLAAGRDLPWRTASSRDTADFVWDTDGGSVLRRSGDVVAQRVVSLAAMRGVVEKWNTVEALRPLMNESRAQMRIGPQPNGSRYGPEAKVTLALKYGADGAAAPPLYATIFNLAADGTIQLLYPLTSDDAEGRLGPSGTLTVIENTVVAPYGADHVVALVLQQRPAAFQALLHSIDGQRSSDQIVRPIHELLAPGGGLTIGELYTGD